MGQLVIKKVSWWEHHAKQLLVWTPVAALQASTLVGLGYFYQRVNALEANGDSPATPSVLGSSLQDVKPLPAAHLSRVPLPPPPSASAISISGALKHPAIIDLMRVGQDFSTVPLTHSADVAPKKPLTAKPVVKKVKQANALKPSDDTERVAQANRSEAFSKRVSPDTKLHLTPGLEEIAVVAPPEVPRGQPLPVGSVVWVYLGELREQGWHGQRLHIASDSGLPVVGGQYRTQKIHGLYDQPYGNRTMGGFQKGDLVEVLVVRHEANAGVWAQVRKIRSVGKPGCVTCTQ